MQSDYAFITFLFETATQTHVFMEDVWIHQLVSPVNVIQDTPD